MDIVLPKIRSKMMSSVKNKDTNPEIIIRKIIFGLGFRFRINQRIGNTRPDIVLKKWNLCIFVHGCFWHQHQNCKFCSRPKSNIMFWNKKLDNNILRDRSNIQYLKNVGWNVGIIWECFTRKKIINQNLLRNYIISGKSWEI